MDANERKYRTEHDISVYLCSFAVNKLDLSHG